MKKTAITILLALCASSLFGQTAYDALMLNRFADPFDVLTKLYDVLGEYRFFENKTVVMLSYNFINTLFF